MGLGGDLTGSDTRQAKIIGEPVPRPETDDRAKEGRRRADNIGFEIRTDFFECGCDDVGLAYRATGWSTPG